MSSYFLSLVESREINNYWLSGIINNIQSSFLLFPREISQDFNQDSHQEIYFEGLSMFCFYQLIPLNSTFKTLKCKISIVSQYNINIGLPCWLCGKEAAWQCRRRGFYPWVRKTSWSRTWQHTTVFLLGKSHGQRGLVGYSPWSCKTFRYDLETKQQQHVYMYVCVYTCMCVCIYIQKWFCSDQEKIKFTSKSQVSQTDNLSTPIC